jgi:glutamyl-tRNA reductase
MSSTEEARTNELERALGLIRAGGDARRVAEELSHRLTNKLLDGPTRALRERTPPCTSTS